MKRITISVPDDLAGYVEREAARRRTSVSELVRDALVAHVKPKESPFEAIIGIFEGTEENLAENMKDILAVEWADWIARDSGLR